MNDTALTEEEFWSILRDIPEPNSVFYRLYYTNDGSPVIYSMEELPGNYIEVDPSTYALAPFNVKVIDGELVYIKPVITVKKLQPNDLYGTTCDPRDICVVVGTDQTHIKWSMVQNETH